MATIYYPNGKTVQVKNLGWLLRNWQQVHKLFFFVNSNKGLNDGELVALLKNGGKYKTNFASLTVCFNFLNRPVFRGLEIDIIDSNSFKTWVVGNEEYKLAQKQINSTKSYFVSIAYLSGEIEKIA